jgi:hypothetical protein
MPKTSAEIKSAISDNIRNKNTAGSITRGNLANILDDMTDNISIPALNLLSGTSWDIDLDPLKEITLIGNLALTITNIIAGKSRGFILINNPASYTLSINGASVPIRANGETAVTVIARANGALYLSSDSGDTIKTSIVSDSFNRSAGALGAAEIGGVWTTIPGYANINTNGTAAVASANGAAATIPIGVTDNYDFTVAITTLTTNADAFYVLIGVNATNTGNLGIAILPKAGTVNGVSGSGTFAAFAAGDILKVTKRGTTLNILKNGSVIGTYTITATLSTYIGFYLADTQTTIDYIKVEQA